jgi:hypothetical protein
MSRCALKSLSQPVKTLRARILGKVTPLHMHTISVDLGEVTVM